MAGNEMLAHAAMSAREALVGCMFDKAARYHNVIAYGLGVRFPDGLDRSGYARTAYLFSEMAVSLKEGRVIEDPCHRAGQAIKSAEENGRRYDADVEDAMCYLAMGMLPFWHGLKHAKVFDVFMAMLYDGTSDVFGPAMRWLDQVLAAEDRRARMDRLNEFIMSYDRPRRDRIMSDYNAAVAEAEAAYKSVPQDIADRLRSVTAGERAAVEAADAEWQARRCDRVDRPTPREARRQAESDAAWDRLQDLEDALREAERERCPEYFEAVRQNKKLLDEARKSAAQKRDTMLEALNAEAVAVFGKRFPEE